MFLFVFIDKFRWKQDCSFASEPRSKIKVALGEILPKELAIESSLFLILIYVRLTLPPKKRKIKDIHEVGLVYLFNGILNL